MNKSLKVFLAIIGGINVIFSLFFPIALSLVLIKTYSINGFGLYLLIIIGSLSSFYRAIDIAGFETLSYILEKIKAEVKEDGTRRKKHI